MRFIKSFIPFFFLILFNTSFSQNGFKVRITNDFNPDATFIVQSYTSRTNLDGLIESELLFNGFDVINSSIGSSKKSEVSNNGSFFSNGWNQNITSSKTTYLKSEYYVEFDFTEGYDTWWTSTWKVRSVVMKIADLNTGKQVAVIRRKSNSLINAERLAEKLVSALMREMNK